MVELQRTGPLSPRTGPVAVRQRADRGRMIEESLRR